MNRNKFRPVAAAWIVSLLLAIAPAAFGQFTNTPATQTQNQNPNTALRSVPSGSKMKFRGVVISRDADVFTIRDRSRADYQVVITDNTSIKTNGGFLRRRAIPR